MAEEFVSENIVEETPTQELETNTLESDIVPNDDGIKPTKKTYKYKDATIDIPTDKADEFKSKYPEAVEMVAFDVDGTTIDVPTDKAYEFTMKYRNAKPINYDLAPKKPQAPQQPFPTFQDNKQTVTPQQPQTEIKEPRKRTKSEIKNSFNLPEDGNILAKPSSIYENINTTFQTPDGRTVNLWDDKFGVSITTPDGITRPFNINADMQSVPADQKGNLMRFIGIQQNVVKQNNERAKVYYQKLANEGNMTDDEKMQYAKIFGSQYLNNIQGDAYNNLQQSYSDLEKAIPYYIEKGLDTKWDKQKQKQFIQQIQEQDAIRGRTVYANPFDLKTTYETSRGRIRNNVEQLRDVQNKMGDKAKAYKEEIKQTQIRLRELNNMKGDYGADQEMAMLSEKLQQTQKNLESVSESYYSIDKSIEKIEYHINKPTKEGANAVWYELKNIDWTNMLTLGYSRPISESPTLQIAKKKASGVPLTDDEEFALNLYQLNEMVKSSIPSTSSGNIVYALSETIPYMASLALTGGTGTALKIGTETLLKKMLPKFAMSNSINRAIGATVRATFQGAMLGSTVESAVNATIANPETNLWYNLLKEVPSAALSSMIEIRLVPLVSNLSKMTTKEIGSIYAQSLRKSVTGKIDDVVSSTLGSTKELVILNEFVGEFGEEKADQFKSILLGEDSWRNFFSLRNNLETFSVVALMQGGGKILKKGIQGADVLDSRKEYLKSMSQLPEQFKVNLITALNQPTPQQQQEAFSKIPLEQVTNIEDRRKIVDFLNAKASYDFTKGALMGKQQLDVAEGTVQQAMDYAQGIENADGNIVLITDKETGKKYISKAFNPETGMHIAIPYDGSEIVALSETTVDIAETIPTIEFAQGIVQNKLEELKLAQQQQEAVQDMEDVQMASDVMQQQGGSYDVGDQVTINGKQATITGSNDGRGNFMVTIETPDGIGESVIANQSMFDSEVNEQPLSETPTMSEMETVENQEQSQDVAPSGDNANVQADIEAKKADIERRRQEKLEKPYKTFHDGSNTPVTITVTTTEKDGIKKTKFETQTTNKKGEPRTQNDKGYNSFEEAVENLDIDLQSEENETAIELVNAIKEVNGREVLPTRVLEIKENTDDSSPFYGRRVATILVGPEKIDFILKNDAELAELNNQINPQQKQQISDIERRRQEENEKRAEYDLEELKPTYRGTTLSEWENIQDGKIISSDNMQDTTWVSDKKEYSDEFVKNREDGVLIEFRPEAIDKSVHESGQVNDTTGVRLGKGLTINDIQRVTDSKGKVLYDAELQALESTQPTDVSTQPQSINTEATDVSTQPTPEIPRLKDGSPDFDNMQPEMLGVELEKQFGNDRAKSILLNQIKNQREALKRLDKKQAKTINEEAKNDTEKNKVKDNIKRLETSLMGITESTAPTMKKREQPKQKVVSNDIQQISEVYQSSPKVYGRSKQMTLPNGEKVKGRFVLIEAGSAVPSHDPFTFAKTKGFPTTETGTTVNDRDYEKDEKAQGEVILQSQKLDDRAYSNPVMITSDGIVVSGNQRTMTRIRAVQQGTDTDYTTPLREDIDMYGISQEQFDNLNNPQLVFELDETPDYTTNTFAKFNTEDKKSQSTTESAVKVSKTIKPDTISKIGDILDKYETLGEFYSDNQAIAEALTILQTDGVIRGNDVARLVKSDGVGLSDSGKEFFETLLIGSILNESAIRQIDVEGMRNVKQKIAKAIVPIVNNAKLKEYNLVAEISEAVNIVERARKNKLSVSNYISNGNIFDKNEYSDAGVFFAVLLDNSKESQFRNAIINYNENAILAESGQMDIFSGEVTTKEQIVETLIQNADAETKQIQQKAWDAVKQNRDANAFFATGTTPTGSTDVTDVAETPAVTEATSEVKESISPTPETPTETKQRQKEVVADALGIESQRIAEVETMLNELSDKTKKQAKTTVVRSNADAIVQMKKDKVDTVFIQAFQDVVAKGHKPEAIMTNGGLYIVSSNIKDTQRAVEVWFHEQAGHYGIRLIMPDATQRKAFFIDIYNSVGEANIREALGEGYTNVTKPETLGEEYFGRVCEKVARQTSLNELEQGVWENFLNKLREFISNLLPSAKLSQGQIESIAKASIQNIIEVRQKTDIQARQKNADIEVKADSTNTNPTEAQKEAGNYEKGKVSIQGLQITIENPKGSVRSGTDKEGNDWFVELNNHYGYFNRTNGKDGDQIDVFIGDNPTSKKVFVVDQVDTETREFDESKVMLGFDTIEDAELNYLLNYEAGWQGLGKITEVDIDTFKTWLNDGKRQLKPFGEYKEFKKKTPMFSIAKQDKNLLAIHNISTDGIKKAIKMGGLAQPSIAIINKNNPFTNFGEITLVMDKQTIDPKNRNVNVFGADVYSPRYPAITYTIPSISIAKINKYGESIKNEKIKDEFTNRIKNDIENNGGDRRLFDNGYLAVAFLDRNNIKFKTEYRKPSTDKRTLSDFKKSKVNKVFDWLNIYKDAELMSELESLYVKDMEYKYQKLPELLQEMKDELKTKDSDKKDNLLRYFYNGAKRDINEENKIDEYATFTNAKNKIKNSPKLEKEYRKDIESFYDSLNVEERIFKGFTNAGNRRYVPYTLENVLKEKKEEGIRAGEGFGYGLPSIRAKATKQFRTLKEVSESGKSIVTPEIFEESKKTMQEYLEKINELIAPYYKFSRYDDNVLIDEISALANRGRSESFDQLPEDVKKNVSDFYTALKEMPTEYFEAVISRVVDFSDFSHALVPKGTDVNIIEYLKKQGVNVMEYKKEERHKTLNKVAEESTDILFSIAPESIEDKLSRLTPLQRKQAEQSISGINKQIDESQTAINNLQKEIDKKRKSIDSRISQATQTSMFDEPTKDDYITTIADVFAPDLSQQRRAEVLKPMQKQLQALQTQYNDLVKQRRDKVNQAITQAKSQLEMDFGEPNITYLNNQVQEKGVFDLDTGIGQMDMFASYKEGSYDGKKLDVTYMERMLSKQKGMTFMGEGLTGVVKIKSANDVAFLFKNLESASSENAFAVLHKNNGDYKVLYLGTGGTTSAVIDIKPIIAAMDDYDSVTLVHNHPSGNLDASDADRNIHRRLELAMLGIGKKSNMSIIINLDSGKYTIFTGSDISSEKKKDVKGKIKDVDVYSFDRQKLYVPSAEKPLLNSAQKTAEYLSKMKRGSIPKIITLVLDNKLAVNRVVMFDESITQEELVSNLLKEVSKHGEHIILASNKKLNRELIEQYLGKIGSNLLDVVTIKQDSEITKSEQDIMFSIAPTKEYKPIPKQYYDKLLTRLNKAFPNVSISTDTAEMERVLNEVEGVQKLTTPTGELYGMTHMGKVYLDGNKMNANAPIHEYGHIWADIAQKQYPEVYNHGLELIKGTEYETAVRESGSYKGLSDEQIWNEALITAIGDRGERIVDKAIRNKFVSWLKDLFNNIRMRLGINRVADLSKFDLSKMDLSEFVKRVNLDLLGGVPISYMSSSDIAKRDADKLIIGIKGATRLDEVNEATIRVDNLKVAEEMEGGGEIGLDNYDVIGLDIEDDGNQEKYIEKIFDKLGVDYTRSVAQTGTIYYGIDTIDGDSFKLRYANHGKGSSGRFAERKTDANIIYNESDTLEDIAEKLRDELPDGKLIQSKQFSPTEIRLATGWERGADNKWRYEVEDGKYKRNIFTIIKEKTKGLTLSDVWVDDYLFKSYPQLKSIPFDIAPIEKGTNGFYDGEKIVLNETLVTDDETQTREELIRSTLIHEIQHAIQSIEGFARGGNEKTGIEIGTNNLTNAEYKLNQFVYNNQDKTLSELEKMPEYKKLDNDVKLAKLESEDGNINYLRLAGEVEARNAQARMNFTPEQRILQTLASTEDISRADQIIIHDTVSDAPMFSIAPKDLKADTKMVTRTRDVVREVMQDRLLSVKMLQDYVVSKGGTLTNATDTKAAVERYSSKVNGRFRIFEMQVLRPLTKFIANIEKTYNLDSYTTRDYLLAKASLARHNAGTDALSEDLNDEWNIEAVKKIITDYEIKVDASDIAELWDKTNTVNDFSMKALKDAGILTKEQYDTIKAKWDYYVPLRGWDLPDEVNKQIELYTEMDKQGIARTGDTTYSEALKKAKGRKSKAYDPISTMSNIAYSTLITAEKNIAEQSMLNFIRQNKDFIEDVAFVKRTWIVKSEDGTKETEVIDRPDQSLFDAGRVTNKRNKDTREFSKYVTPQSQQAKQIEVYENGIKYVIEFKQSGVAEAIRGTNMYKMPKVFDVTLGEATRFLSKNLTGLNPDFIPVNFIRDFGYAMLTNYVNANSKISNMDIINEMRQASKAIKAFSWSDNFDETNPLHKDFINFINNGGATGYVNMQKLEKVKKQIDRDLKVLAGSESKFEKSTRYVKAPFAQATRAIGFLGDMSELIMRYSVYRAGIKAGVSVNESVDMAKNITVNFNRKGRISGVLGGLYAFYNASIQGGNNFATLAYQNKGKMAKVALSFMAMGALWNVAMTMLMGGNPDDDESYYNVNEFSRYNNLIIPTGGKNYIKIPLPHVFRSFFAMGQIGVEMMTGQKSFTQGILGSMDAMLDGLSPVNLDLMALEGDYAGSTFIRTLLPTTIQPMWDLGFNRNFFGQTITRETFDKSTPKSQLGKANVSPVVRTMAETFNAWSGGDKFKSGVVDINPSAIEYLFESYTGGRGRFYLNLVKIGQSVFDKDIVLETKNIPIGNRFIGENRGKNWGAELKEMQSAIREDNDLMRKYYKNMDESKDFKQKYEAIAEKYDNDIVWTRGTSRNRPTPNLQAVKILDDHNKQSKLIYEDINSAESQVEKDRLYKVVSKMSKETVKKLRVYKIK